jgi:very-short-patch-repair endonuclease
MKNKQEKDPKPSGVIFLQRVGDHKIKQSRDLRKKMTPEERLFWERVRANRILGLHFRRQQIVEGFLVDFYCNKARCVVEIDGGIHNEPEQQEIDAHRRAVFESRGLTEIRFTNNEIHHEMDDVIERLKKTLKSLLTSK